MNTDTILTIELGSPVQHNTNFSPIPQTPTKPSKINNTKSQIATALRYNQKTSVIERITKQFGDLRDHEQDEDQNVSKTSLAGYYASLKFNFERLRSKKIVKWSVKGLAGASWALVFISNYLTDPYTVSEGSDSKISQPLLTLRSVSMSSGALATFLMFFFKTAQKDLENELKFLRTFLRYDLEKKKLMEVEPTSVMDKTHLQIQVQDFLNAYDNLPQNIKQALPERDLWISYLLNSLPEKHPVKQKLVEMKDIAEQGEQASPRRVVQRNRTSTQADNAPAFEDNSFDSSIESDIKSKIDFKDCVDEFCGRSWSEIEFDGIRLACSGTKLGVTEKNILVPYKDVEIDTHRFELNPANPHVLNNK